MRAILMFSAGGALSLGLYRHAAEWCVAALFLAFIALNTARTA